MKSKFDWRATYFHLVSLVGIITIIIAAIAGGHGLLRLILPVLSMDQDTWERVQSFEAYKRNPDRVHMPPPTKTEVDSVATVTEETSDDELRSQWEDERNLLIQGQRRRGLWFFIESLVTLAIVSPIFWWHRRAAKRLRRNEKEENDLN